MMLSNVDIKQALKNSSLIVEPCFEEAVRPSGLMLHLGAQLLRPVPGKIVDIRNNVIPDYEEITISNEQPYLLEPSAFILGHTYEAVTVGANLALLIEGRSTLARVGLTIVQTAMLVYPGHSHRAITLELANHGPNPILLYPKMKIARIALIELRSPSSELYDDKGKYRQQVSVGRPIFEHELLNNKGK